MTVPQWTLDMGLRLGDAGGMRRFGRAAVSAARKLQVKLHDPLVSYQIGEVTLRLPLSHQLPYYRSAFPQYSSNIGRIGAAVQRKYPDMSLIDIGANVGDTVAIVRQSAHYPVLCIEGATAFLPLLRGNVDALDDVEIEPAFLGGSPGLVAATLRMTNGTAHLAMDSPHDERISLRSLNEVLQRHLKFEHAKLLKSDTDGMDCQIIAGAADYLEAVRPVLFFEYDPDLTARAGATAIEVFDVLDATGYQHALVYENTGDLILLLELQDKRLLADLNGFFTGHKGARYADICAFHAVDSDLALSLRDTEREFFGALRSSGQR